MQKNKLKSLIHFHFIVFIFGFTAILGSLISIDSLSLVWYRMSIASVILITIALIMRINLKVKKDIFFQMLIAGILISLHWVTFFKAIKVSNVSITLSVLSLGAFITSFLEPLIYRRKIIKYEIFLGTLVFIGTFLIFQSQMHYFEGIVYALISVLLSVLFALINGKLIEKSSAIVISIYELFAGFIFITITLLISDQFDLNFFNLNDLDFLWILILGVFCTAYAYVVSVNVLKHLTPYSTMISINMEPVYGIIMAIIFLDENKTLSHSFYIGFLLIFFSIFLNGIIKLKNKKQ
ncbi:MAG: EamA family transporter [Flavobacteriaceae bacterium]|nr:EamA family transporter [Flavobacteriaceae bacterium]